MNLSPCIIDTGALVSLLDRSDSHHQWAVHCFKVLRPPLLTCESVLAEAAHLLSDLQPSMEGLDRLHQEGIIRVDFCFESHASVIWRLMKKYRDLPMDFADACLVRIVNYMTIAESGQSIRIFVSIDVMADR